MSPVDASRFQEIPPRLQHSSAAAILDPVLILAGICSADSAVRALVNGMDLGELQRAGISTGAPPRTATPLPPVAAAAAAAATMIPESKTVIHIHRVDCVDLSCPC